MNSWNWGGLGMPWVPIIEFIEFIEYELLDWLCHGIS
jgi:hypothetical protein